MPDDGGEDFVFIVKELEKSSTRSKFLEGQRVSFDITTDPAGKVASRVQQL
jgi:cold shock CspA family protein